MRARTYRVDRLALGGLAVLLVALVVDVWLGPQSLVRPLVASLAVALVPGGLFLRAVGVEPAPRARWFVYAVGVSLLLLALLGVLSNLLLAPVGVAEPLGAGPLLGGLVLLVGLLVAANARWGGPVEWRPTVSFVPLGPAALGFLLLPPAAVLAVTLLNRTGQNLPLVVVLSAIALVPLAVVTVGVDERYLSLGVFATALAVVYHKSLWRSYVYSGHASTIAIWETGRWTPAIEPLLPNGVLSPGLARLAGVHILTQLHVLNPALVALLPVVLHVSFRNYTSPRRAFLGASFFVFAHPFYFQYPPAGRAAMPVFYLALVGAVVGDSRLTPFTRNLLGLVFSLGIIVSHYGTAYYVMFAVLGALVLLVAFDVVDTLRLDAGGYAADGGEPAVGDPGRTPAGGLLTRNYGFFYVTAVVAWYLYTGGGRHFTALVGHIGTAYRSLAAGGSTGSTAVRLVADYGALSIRLSKIVYAVVGLLMVGGLVATYYRRLRDGDRPVDDEYLALSSMLLALFGTTFVVAGQWGGGRPMLIVFSLTGVFAVVGAEAGWSLTRTVLGRTSFGRGFLGRTRRAGSAASAAVPLAGVGALLAVMLLLNSGVAAAVVLGGYAPSNVPVQPTFDDSPRPEIQSLRYVESDIATHAWLVDHRDPSLEVYGDRVARGQATDKYAGEIAARSTEPLYRFPKKNHPKALGHPGVEQGYLLLLGHTVEHGTVSVTFVEWEPVAGYDLELAARDKVYANDHAAVYLHQNQTAATTPARRGVSGAPPRVGRAPATGWVAPNPRPGASTRAP